MKPKYLSPLRVWTVGLVGCLLMVGVETSPAQSLLPVQPASGFPGIQPQDALTTRYNNPVQIEQWASPVANQAALQTHLQMVQSIVPSVQRVETIPAMIDRFYLDPENAKSFSVREFETVMAMLKTTARQLLSTDSLQVSLERVRATMSGKLASRYTPSVPFSSALSEYSAGGFTWIDPTTAEAEERAWKQLVQAYGVNVVTVKGVDVVVIGADVKNQDPVVLGPYEDVTREWYAGQPVTLHSLHLRAYNGLPLGSRIVVPAIRNERVYGLAAFNPYDGDLVMHSIFADSYDALANPSKYPAEAVYPMRQYPLVSTEEAERWVIQQTGEKPIRSILTTLNGDVALPIPAVLTDSGNVYFADPMIQHVW